jgi:hypothetical protein
MFRLKVESPSAIVFHAGGLTSGTFRDTLHAGFAHPAHSEFGGRSDRPASCCLAAQLFLGPLTTRRLSSGSRRSAPS